MAKIFISYRRIDSQHVTDSIYEHMVRHFGKANVFLDVGSIPAGVDFRRYLNDQIAANDVVLVIIGPDWAKIMHERSTRRNDFVRIEIESALQQGKLVIPVFVKNASMPDFSLLPRTIKKLQWINGVQVRRVPDLEIDCTRLAREIKNHFPVVPPSKPIATVTPPRQTTQTRPPAHKTRLLRSIDIMPAPFEWVEIPHGKTQILTSVQKGRFGFGRIEETKEVDVAPFTIGKYLVTQAQFAKFIEVGGYDDYTNWHQEALTTRENFNAKEYLALHGYSGKKAYYPVKAKWYEVMAFCKWLGRITGEKITLPTEAQWQWAMHGQDNRPYTWGHDFRARNYKTIDNFAASQFEKTTNSAFGIVDMVGKYGEWTSTRRDYRGRVRLVTKGNRPLGAGQHERVLRIIERRTCSPDDWSTWVGFRLCKNF